MVAKIDRTGEERLNNFGSKIVITRYGSATDIDVYFPEYDWTFKGTTYSNFKKGNVRCPYDRSVYGIGYIGEGKYKVNYENGKQTRVYRTWYGMLRRCYDKKSLKRNPTYEDCNVSKEFHNFQNFGEWDKENFYQIEGEVMCLHKDILIKHNRIYSPETCIFVPKTINLLFTKRQNDRGESAIGVTLHQGKCVAQCHMINPKTGKSKQEYLGRYDTQEEAFKVYKYYKEKNIKQVADYYRKQIPEILYNVLYNYEVEIDD